MSDSEDIPDVQTCQKLVEQFAAITDTDEACAQFFLQDRRWNLEQSVNDYFEAKSTSGVTVGPTTTAGSSNPEASVVINVNKSLATALSAIPKRYPSPPKYSVPPHSYRGLESSTLPPPCLRVMSWNVDGLDDHNLKRRTKAVCHIIFSKEPDVVFLQEVIPKTFVYIKKNMPEYYCIPSCKGDYFTVTMLRLFTVKFGSFETIEFPGSSMGRNLLVVKAHMGSLKLALINTHLESTAEFTDERVQQLKKTFQVAKDMPADHTVIFGGDLNLREKELTQCGGIPHGMCDLWVQCGSRDTCKYTWDSVRNSNIQMKGGGWKGRFNPRCRFDRLFMRPSAPPMLKADFFGVLGLKKVPSTETFPSDHWAIWAYLTLLVRESAGSESKLPSESFKEFDARDVELFSSSDEESPPKRSKSSSSKSDD